MTYNKRGVGVTVRAISALTKTKTNLYDLFRLHALARGTLVGDAKEADIVFSAETGIQFKTETIASEYMK